MSLPSPTDWGAPPKFAEWRRGQEAAFETLLGDPRRFQILNLPTGLGKSLTYMAYALFEDKRTVVLTETKALQDQLYEDQWPGLADVRGMSNYPCVAEGGTCEVASCVDGNSCYLREKGCHYYDAVKAGLRSRLTSTNYSWWFSWHASERTVGDVDILVCDEAHLIAESMSAYLSVWLGDREVEWGPDPHTRDHAGWREWAKVHAAGIRLAGVRNKWERKKLRELRDRLKKLERMEDDWIFERKDTGWTFDPIWPAKYMEEWLWRGAKRVVLTSATIRPKTLELLGVTDAHFVEYDSPIPVRNRPVYYIPTARITYRVDEVDLWRWVSKMDQIIEGRLDRKGIIHAVSFDRAQFIKANSKYGDLMIVNESGNTKELVSRFKSMDPPAVLVSPSVHTGHDFVGDAARYQIIAKVPFHPPSALLKARTAEDKTYPYYLAMMGVVQAAGRVCRGPEDFGETFILDEQFGWLLKKWGQFAPRWFRKAVMRRDEVPPAPRLHKE